MANKKPLVLAILDGWGYSAKPVGNAIAQANKPSMDAIAQAYPMVLLQASGLAVGMTWGETGNSEVGHLNIGAGRIVEQYLSRINRAIDNGEFFSNQAIKGAFDHAKRNNSRVHIVGLLTSGTVHAAFGHLVALLELAGREQQAEIYLHLFLDGKDSGLHEGADLLAKLDDQLKRIGYGKVASLIGRDLAMDRDNNWDRTRQAYDLIVNGQGEKITDASALKTQYQKGQSDSAIPPMLTGQYAGIGNNDAAIFFNFREDSMRQILKPFIADDFAFFAKVNLQNTYICTMTQYLEDTEVKVAFMPPEITNNLAEYISAQSKTQLHVAETEKYAHVTYFFNGLHAPNYSGETDVFIESDKNYIANPAMKSQEIAAKTVEAVSQNMYDFIILNLANPDMLAHTGNFTAAVQGIEAVDRAIGAIKEATLAQGGTLIITADHGNAESMVYRGSGEEETRHDDNPVPLYLVTPDSAVTKDAARITREISGAVGILADIAPTILELMGLPMPAEMTGNNLLPYLR